MILPFLLSIVVSIASFGAKPNDENVNNATSINKAIETCAQKGGGEVTVPEGTYTTGTIYMMSNVRIRLEKGATLKGSTRLTDYSPLKTSLNLSKYESGQGTVNYNSATDPQWSLAMIFGVNISNSGIVGEGTIDGNNVRNPLGEEHMRGPHTIILAGCKNMRFENFSVKNSANYAILGYKLEKSDFNNLRIYGGWDGIHLRGAKNIAISKCELHTGADAIAGGYWEKMRIHNCILNSSCNGIRMIMPSVDVDVAHCHIYGPGEHEHITSHRTNSEAAINLEPGAWGKAPGRLDRIHIHHNKIERVLTPLSVTLSDDNSAGKITVDNIVARGITRMAMSVKSWGKAPTDVVVVSDCDMEFNGIDDPSLPAWFDNRPTSEWPVFPCWGMYFRNVGKVEAKRVKLRLAGKDYRKAYICDNVGKENLNKACIYTGKK